MSNALKRTAVKFGIGRYLYSFDPIWVRCEVKGKTKVIARDEFDTTLATFYKRQLVKIYGVDATNNYSTTNINNGQVQSKANENNSYSKVNNNYNNTKNSWIKESNEQQLQESNKQSNDSRFNTESSKVDYWGNRSKFNEGVNPDELVNKQVTSNTNYFQSENAKPKVPGAFLNFIKGRIQATGKEISSILTYYKVKALEELSMEQANDLEAKLG